MSATATDRTGVSAPGRAKTTQGMLRCERWWLPTFWSDLGLRAFIIYGTTRAFRDSAYWVDQYHYLTPFYSPVCQRVVYARLQSPRCVVGPLPVVSSVEYVGAAVPGRFPDQLMRQPQGLLSLGVAVATGMRSGRTVLARHRQDAAAADRPKCASVLLLHRDGHVCDRHLRPDAFHSPSGFDFVLVRHHFISQIH